MPRITPFLWFDTQAEVTVDTYGGWLPIGNKAAVDRLDKGFATPDDGW
jgi:predicted 3-demethylubiquinone-9 3-methyltransferase (glyoxalase superfamily)